MIKNFTKHGNSVALVIDKPVLELLDLDPEGQVNITTDGRNLVISPVTDEKEEITFREAMKVAHKRYGRMLKALAE